MRTFGKFICPKYGWDQATFLNDIERGHRLSSSTDENDDKKEQCRPIVVRFYSWKTAQQIKDQVIKGNKEGLHRLTVTQLYSKETITKQNELLQKRRELLNKHKDFVIRIKYPFDSLLVKKPNEKNFSIYEESDE